MTTIEQLEQRVAAVENTVTNGDVEFEEISEITQLIEDVAEMSEQLEALERRLVAVEGATESLEGYVGNVRSVNEETEDRADAAIAAVDRLEQKIETFERQVSVEAFEALTERVERLEQDQQQLAQKRTQESETPSEFVFGTPPENGDGDSDQPAAGRPTTTEPSNGAEPIDPAANDHDRHENSQSAERLPPQQQRMNETYGSGSPASDAQSDTQGNAQSDAQSDEDEADDDGTFGNLLSFDNGVPEWMKK
ncbi:hypothetical protein EGH22_17225 [Halomicroarcula sp. F28]|uniref:DUF7310 family coiled-coil domain-containing protein n=1 Tax=Haloarcula salinisoli TaxID=2487746 RepID=UPI001C72B246|nr:hypothetical protein [Halomicroarcula salinisoli]MBX0288077.1 hypothetical protein [Halomicroarcula salinisoli]